VVCCFFVGKFRFDVLVSFFWGMNIYFLE